jgi:hypothetical protein
LGRPPETLPPEEIEGIKDKVAHGVTRAEIAIFDESDPEKPRADIDETEEQEEELKAQTVGETETSEPENGTPEKSRAPQTHTQNHFLYRGSNSGARTSLPTHTQIT